MERCGHSSVFSGRSLRRRRASGLSDASSGPSPGEAAARCGFVEAANSKFKIKRAFWARLGIYFRSGRSLRRTHVRVRTAGLRRPKLRPAGRCATDSAQKNCGRGMTTLTEKRAACSCQLWARNRQQIRSRRDRQPAAAPGRRAAPLRRRPVRSAAGSFQTVRCRRHRRTAASRARRPATRVPQVGFERALRRLRPAFEVILNFGHEKAVRAATSGSESP